MAYNRVSSRCTYQFITAIRQLNQDVRVRFAPSPTGALHLGGLRTALYNYLFAKKHNGQFILRIEDTDQARLVPGSVDQIYKILDQYGLSIDEGSRNGGNLGPYLQSKRLDIYKSETEKLIDAGHAYPCFCSDQRLDLLRKNAARTNTIPKYDRRCRSISASESAQRIKNGEPYVVRFKMDKQDVSFELEFLILPFLDEVFGPVTQTLDESDAIILKSDGFPTYHLANVVDDRLMKISHVIRGMEWLSSTGKHLLLYKSFGWQPPKFVHLPLITRDGKKKLSKRDKDAFVDYYSESLGALPAAVLNLLIRNGSGIADFNPGKLYSLEEMIASFDEKLMGKRNLQMDEETLHRLSRLAFQQTPNEELVNIIRHKIAAEMPDYGELETSYLLKVVEFLKAYEERFAYFSELTTGHFSWFLKKPTSAKQLLSHFDKEAAEKSLTALLNKNQWSIDALKEVASSSPLTYSKFIQLLRCALIDSTSGPPIQELIRFIGIDDCKQRISKMVSYLRLSS